MRSKKRTTSEQLLAWCGDAEERLQESPFALHTGMLDWIEVLPKRGFPRRYAHNALSAGVAIFAGRPRQQLLNRQSGSQ